MSCISESLDKLAEAIRSINPYANPTVRIEEPKVDLQVGKCINCGYQVRLRQPWLSNMPIVNDGWYVLHCENEGCHNYYGMELRENEFSIADFVEWNEKHLIKNQETETVISSNIIPFEKWYKGNCHA